MAIVGLMGVTSKSVRLPKKVVSARPSVSAASTQARSALRMQPRRTKPLRGGPTAPSPMEPVRVFDPEIHKRLELNDLRILCQIRVDRLPATTYVAQNRILGQTPMGIEWPDPRPADATGGLFGLTERCSRGRVDVAMRSAGTATEGVPIPPPEGGRSRIRVWHHGNTDRDATSSYVIRSYPMSGTVRDLLRPPRAGSTVGVPRPRSSGPHHTGDRSGSGSP